MKEFFTEHFTDNDSLGHRIENSWCTLGDKLEEFGNRFDRPVSKETIHIWENNLYQSNPKRTVIIADLGGISVYELLHGKCKGYLTKLMII